MNKKIFLFIASFLLVSIVFTSIFPPNIPSVKAEEPPPDFWIYPVQQPYQIYAPPRIDSGLFWDVFFNSSGWSCQYNTGSPDIWVWSNGSIVEDYIKMGKSLKETLSFTAPEKANYSFRNVITRWNITHFNNESATQINMTFDDNGNVFYLSYNFSDIYDYEFLDFDWGVDEVNHFWFEILASNVNKNFHIDLDPEYTVYTGSASLCLNNARCIGRQSNGTLVMVFRLASSVEVYNSEDSGETWNLLHSVAQVGLLGYPTLAIDSLDVIHVVFDNTSVVGDAGLFYFNSTDWVIYEVDTNASQAVLAYPAIAIDSNDKLHVVYEKPTEGTSNDNQVAYINSSDGGISWSDIQVLTDEADNGDDEWYPSIAINSSDSIHVVFECEGYRPVSLDYQVLHIYSDDSGLTWTDWKNDLIVANVSGRNYLNPCLAIDGNDVLHVAMYSYESGIYSVVYYYNDSSWSPHEEVFNMVNSGSFCEQPTIGIAEDDNKTIFTETQKWTTEYLLNISHSYNDSSSWVHDPSFVNWGNSGELFPNMLHATYPEGNIPMVGYCFVYQNHTNSINFYKSADLLFEIPPVNYSQVTPINGATEIDLTPTISAYFNFNDSNGDIYWYQTNSGGTSWILKDTDSNVNNGTQSMSDTSWVTLYNTVYYFGINATNEQGGWSNNTYSFTTKTNVPAVPSIFTATTWNSTQINLSWTKGARADYTYIRYNDTAYPTTRSEGAFLYNGTGTSTEATGLNVSQTYYFSAWSFNSSAPTAYSVSYASDTDTTDYWGNTSVDSISPYWQNLVSTVAITATATGDQTPTNVTLWYRWSDDNTSWDGGIGNENNDTVDFNTCDIDSSPDIGTETDFANAQDTVPDADVMNLTEALEKPIDDWHNPVDNADSDVDSSPDIGIETNFANSQDEMPDTDVMTLVENDTEWNQRFNQTVSWNGADVDSLPDVGTETNFANAQDVDPDSDVMALVEYNNGITGVSEWKYVDATNTSLTLLEWETEVGASPYLDTPDDGNYIHEDKSASAEEGWFDFHNISATGTGFTVNFSFYCYGDDNNDGFVIHYDTGGGDTTLDEFIITNQNAPYEWITHGTTLSGLTATQVNDLKIMLDTSMNGGGDDIYVDCARIGVSRAGTTDYEASFEYQFNGANYTQDNEEVCIYVDSITGGDSENMEVYDWTGSGWNSIGTITGTGWNNFTADNLNSATYNIQFNDSSRSDESTQTTWNIDVIKLRCWNDTNYKMDMEYQWTTANYSNHDNNKICFYFTGSIGENLDVDYWNGAWQDLGTDITAIGWTNVTATGLASGTYTIRFLGTSESSDTTQTTYTVDVIKMHTWNDTNYKLDMEYNWTNANYSETTELICFYVTALGGENIDVDYYNAGWVDLGTDITSTGWTNITATGLTGSDYHIRLSGTSESSDTNQDSVDFDVIMLHTYNATGGSHGHDWMEWNDASNPDLASPWAWTFNVPNGTAYYEFYSIGRLTGEMNETAPISADAICHVNYSIGGEVFNLTLPSCTPTSGVDSYTIFYFNVTWTDSSGKNPTDGYLKVNVSITGGLYYNMSMAWVSGSNTTGAIYSYSRTLTTSSHWNYTFYGYNGTHYNTSGPHNNPDVSAQSYSISVTQSDSPDLWFNITASGHRSEENVSASGQSAGTPAIATENQGNVPINLTIKVNASFPAGLTLKWDGDNNPTGATEITTGEVQIETNVAVSATENTWLWMDFLNVGPGTGVRQLTITSSSGDW